MQKIILSVLFSLILTMSALATDLGPCSHAIFQTPVGQPYNVKILRPPMWTANRWDCLNEDLGYSTFQNSPANGTDTEFNLAIVYVTNPTTFVYYPVMYVNEDDLHVYIFEVGQSEIPKSDYTVEQGTGKITLNFTPNINAQLYFEILE